MTLPTPQQVIAGTLRSSTMLLVLQAKRSQVEQDYVKTHQKPKILVKTKPHFYRKAALTTHILSHISHNMF